MRKRSTKYIFVTGGVMSSLGKGLASAAIGALLEARGIKISMQKLDPYINIDPGTMNPYQHGEVYVTDDGAETDLDLGHYERFTDVLLSKSSNVTTGKVYDEVISRERKGDYLGETVQVIPHITDEIIKRIFALEGKADVCIVEVGGTVGDIESLPFLESIRQIRSQLGKENAIFVHLTYVPYLSTAGELKTKPTQHSVKGLLEIGIQPDILLCRTDRFLSNDLKKKIALFCNLNVESVITAKDVEIIYEVPLIFHKEGLDHIILETLKMWTKEPDFSKWESIVSKIKRLNKPLKSGVKQKTTSIGVVGKYIEHKDAYKSLHEALSHAAFDNNTRLNIQYVDSEDLEKESPKKLLGSCDGILVPGGFGDRGFEGKISAIKYARENNIPFFGICLGLQMAVVEYARNVCDIKDAASIESTKKSDNYVIDLMPDQKKLDTKGGNMRLGKYPCDVKKGSKIYSAYKKNKISERHRHRYEVNPQYHSVLSKNGLVLSGMSPNGKLVETVELKKHRWFVGCQFHPEFKSKPFRSHPLFRDFIKASLNKT
ncbi:MAG: CTP synthase [Thermodesulfobacteriota bacterium]|nr:CTP synthase [Thermodesulfobacteriota bacterium]